MIVVGGLVQRAWSLLEGGFLDLAATGRLELMPIFLRAGLQLLNVKYEKSSEIWF